MKIIFTFLSALFIGVSLTAQVAVTFEVDASAYVAGGATIDPSGIRIAGNFSTRQGTVSGAAMGEWSPISGTAAMTNMGGNIWKVVVTFPNASKGLTLNYLFVNGNWGMQEGTAGTSTILSGGCGETLTVQGTPLTVRKYTIPQTATTKHVCWDKCLYACNGSAASVEDQAIAGLSVSPNPMTDAAVFKFSTAVPEVTITLMDLTGKVVATKAVATQAENTVEISTAHLLTGSYLYQIAAGSEVFTGLVVKQ